MKMWSGRFQKEISGYIDEWAASIDFDRILYREDIRGSLAHAKMLARQNIISEADAELIESGLKGILAELEEGAVDFPEGTEDIHMGIEGLLTERIGDAGKRLHTARSRNDQVSTDMRLFIKDAILEDISLLAELSKVITATAKGHVHTLMPGYTHLQHAQPVSLAFHLMAWYQMLRRDGERFWNCYKCADTLPLGSGALSGVSYDTDRGFLAEELGFGSVAENAMDAVSDRDFVIEYISAASIAMMHLSRMCEELILWNSWEFGFIEMDDSCSTGSSIMPQKKNPDMAELIRGKTGRVYGDLMAILTVMKGLPLAYNKDMQEDKEPLFDASETLRGCLTVMKDMIASLHINKDRMGLAAKAGFMNATDLADYLVGKGVPFRECHSIVGNLVLRCIEKGVAIEDLDLVELREFSPQFGEDVFERISPEACMNNKKSFGSTAESRTLNQIENAEKSLKE